MVARFNIGAQATILDLKRRACSELARTAQQNYGFTNGFPSGDVASVVLSSGTIFIFSCVITHLHELGSHGQLDFEPSTRVSSVCRANEVIVATVPAPPKDSNVVALNAISSTLSSPIHDRLQSLFQSHANTITADLLLRFDEVVKVEREKREELKAALKVERDKREEALEVEREKWKKALKVEREDWESEKAGAGERYELLKNHLLEVEETTLETAGWITDNVSPWLETLTSTTERVKNRIQKCSTGSSCATS